MTTYNETGWTYNQLATYNGVELNAGMTLVVNGADVTDELAVRSLSIHVGTHGNSLGTLDARLNDPVADPATEQTVACYTGALRLFEGLVRAVELDEHNPGAHHFAKFSAQDAGPDLGLPSAAPFGLSDNPNGSTTMGYRRLRKMARTTEGGAEKVTYTVTYIGDGLWSNMNVQLTSVILGLSAEELTIVDATVKWSTSDAPEYAFEVGEATVKLAQLVEDVTAIAPGAITATEISDGAISTPKLAANAVTAAKIEAEAITTEKIDVGVTVTGMIIIRLADSEVIIDGTSNVFKIAATGTLTITGPDGDPTMSSTNESVDLATGFTYSPAHLEFLEAGGVAYGMPWVAFKTTGAMQDLMFSKTEVVATNQTRVTLLWNSHIDQSAATRTVRYFVLSETAF